jgi:hypothetical protein
VKSRGDFAQGATKGTSSRRHRGSDHKGEKRKEKHRRRPQRSRPHPATILPTNRQNCRMTGMPAARDAVSITESSNKQKSFIYVLVGPFRTSTCIHMGAVRPLFCRTGLPEFCNGARSLTSFSRTMIERTNSVRLCDRADYDEDRATCSEAWLANLTGLSVQSKRGNALSQNPVHRIFRMEILNDYSASIRDFATRGRLGGALDLAAADCRQKAISKRVRDPNRPSSVRWIAPAKAL